MTTPTFDRPDDLTPLAQRALVLGAVGLVIAAIAVLFFLEAFLRAYLVAWLYWLAISLGCFGLLLIHNLTGGEWGLVTRRLLDAGACTLPLMAILFVPIALGLPLLYPWAQAEVVEHDPLLQHKQPYLNAPFFLGRAALYFVLWIAVLGLVRRSMRRYQAGSDPDAGRRMRIISGVGLLLYGLGMTFGAIDWGMSLEPHWFSAIYGVLFVVGQGLAGLSFVVVLLVLLPNWYEPLLRPTVSNLHDLGNLLLGFTMVWTYIAFSQFLIIWFGNLPEEVTWYLHRAVGGWPWVAAALVVFHFFVPFLLLLSRTVKRSANTIWRVALGLLVMRWVEILWLIQPSFEYAGPFVPWLDLAATAAIGGFWLALFAWLLQRNAHVQQEALADE